MAKNVYGFIASPIEDTDIIIDDNYSMEVYQTLNVPEFYSYQKYMTPIKNQGSTSMCVPYALSAVYDYWYNMTNNNYDKTFESSDFPISLVYSLRDNKKEDGMTYKNAFSICKSNEKFKKEYNIQNNISLWGKVTSAFAAKRALIANGPLLIATLVYDSENTQYWKNNGMPYVGGHAVSLVGYDDNKEGFILRNSWGTEYGNNGYSIYPYSDFSKLLECWTLIF